MLKSAFIIILVLALLLIVSIGYAACTVAGHEDDMMEQAYVKWELEHSVKEYQSSTEPEV